MWHNGFPWRRSSRRSSRLRAFGASLLPLAPLLLALVLPACGGIHECNATPWLPAPALTVASGVVYARGAAGISALRADAGARTWRSTNDALNHQRPTPPVVADGFVIASITFGVLIARRLSDGSVAWRSQAVPRPSQGDSLPSLTVADGVVYAAASPDTIAAWRVADGALLWQSPSISPTTDPADAPSYPYTQTPEPVVAGQVVYFVAGKVVRAIRASDGSLLWSTFVLPSPDLGTVTYYTPAVFADGRLFIVVADGSLYALDAATGAVLWHALDPDMAAMPGPSPAPPVNFAPPIVRDGVVSYAPSDGIRGLDAATGHLLWRFPTKYWCPPTSAPVVAGGVVYATTQASCQTSWNIHSGDALVALDAHTGAARWVGGIQPGRAPVTVLVSGDTVYTISPGDGDLNYNTLTPGVVAAWSASKGTFLWQRAIHSPSPIFQQALLASGVIYLSTDGVPNLPAGCDGIRAQPTISALRASDGALLWQTPVPAV